MLRSGVFILSSDLSLHSPRIQILCSAVLSCNCPFTLVYWMWKSLEAPWRISWIVIKFSLLGLNGKPLQYSCLENPMNSMKRQNDRILKEERPRSVGVQYATGYQWRNNSRKNEEMEPKQKQHSVVGVTGDRSKV